MAIPGQHWRSRRGPNSHSDSAPGRSLDDTSDGRVSLVSGSTYVCVELTPQVRSFTTYFHKASIYDTCSEAPSYNSSSDPSGFCSRPSSGWLLSQFSLIYGRRVVLGQSTHSLNSFAPLRLYGVIPSSCVLRAGWLRDGEHSHNISHDSPSNDDPLQNYRSASFSFTDLYSASPFNCLAGDTTFTSCTNNQPFGLFSTYSGERSTVRSRIRS